MTIKRIYLLINPFAGSGRATNSANELKDLLNQKQIPFEVLETQKNGNLVNFARIFANKIANNTEEYLVVVGGDSTLSQAISGIKQSYYPETPLAFLPAGTVNEFKQAAEITTSPADLISLLSNNPQFARLDLGHFTNLNRREENYFINKQSIGFDATFIALWNTSKFRSLLTKMKLGKLVYISFLLRAMMLQSPFEVNVETKEERHTYYKAFLVSVTNHSSWSIETEESNLAQIENQQLSLFVVEKPNFFNLLPLLFKLLKQGAELESPYFHKLVTKEAFVHSKSVQYGQIDGDELGSRTFELKFDLDHFNLYR